MYRYPKTSSANIVKVPRFFILKTACLGLGAQIIIFMKKINLFLVQALVILCLTFTAGCDDASIDSPKKSVADPAGTITANIAGNSEITIGNSDGHIRWCNPDNFHLYGGWDYYGGTYYDRYISICNIGAVSGLGNITKIPTSGYTVPARNNWSIACETGHGYVIKLEGGFAPLYIRLYVVEAIVSTSGGIMGAKVKYQYPFEP